MADLYHQWGGDLVLAPTGTLGLATGPVLGLQRVLRRLMSNPGEYIWNPGYGAGLPAAVGQVAQAARIRAVIVAQMAQEAAVARTPAPVVRVTSNPDGTVFAFVQYADAGSGTVQSLTVPVRT